jgi:hypothetical protein
MQLYCQLGRLTLRVAASLDDKIPSPDTADDDESVDLDDEHPRAESADRVVGFTRNAEAE